MTKLAELKAAFEAATPEDWTLFGGAVCKGRSTITIAQCYQTAVEDEWKRNSEFIALSHNNMAALLEAVERLEAMQRVIGELASTNPFLRDVFDTNKAVLEKLK